MEFLQICKERYATKKFDGRRIDQHLIDQLLEMIRLAPSSFGLQPWKIKIVTEQSLKEKLQIASWNQPQVSTCSHLLVFCADTRIEKQINRYEELMHEAGATAEQRGPYIGMMRQFAQGQSQDFIRNWAQKQTYIAMSHALLGAKALGFDSCPMEGFSGEDYQRILGLPDYLIPTVLVPVGYAADKPRPKIRYSKEEMYF